MTGPDAGERWLMRRVSVMTGLAVLFSLITLVLWTAVSALEHERRSMVRRSAWCDAERVARGEVAVATQSGGTEIVSGLRSEPVAPLPETLPEDHVSARPEDVQQTFPRGVEIEDILAAEVHDVRMDGLLEPVTFGDRSIIPRGSVTIVNLWATFCKPCKEELPRFSELLDAGHWGTLVRFVPVHVLDNTDPVAAYTAVRRELPPAPYQLVDRSPESGALVKMLESHGLYRGDLPVTLVLGCQRRVRWVRFGAVEPSEFGALKATVEGLIDELGSRRCQRPLHRVPSPRGSAASGLGGPSSTAKGAASSAPTCGDGKCAPGELDRCPHDCATCGNGVCEATRGEGARSCPQDCRRKSGAKRRDACRGGNCCGDGRCEPAVGEDCRSCSADCGCDGGMRCQGNARGQWECVGGLL